MEQLNLKDSVGFNLFKKVFSIYILIALIITLYHMYSEYNNVKKTLMTDMQNTKEVLRRQLSSSVWHLDIYLIEDIIRGILDSKSIIGVSIEIEDDQGKGNFGVVPFSKKLESNESFSNRTKVFYKDGLYSLESKIQSKEYADNLLLGTIVFYSDESVVYEKVENILFLIIISSIIKSIALWFIFLFFAKKYLTRPFLEIIKTTGNVNTDNLSKTRFKYNNRNKNEFDILKKTFNKMFKILNVSQKTNLELNKFLEEKNKELLNAQHIAKMGSWSYDIVNNKLLWSDEIFNIFEVDKRAKSVSYDNFLNVIYPEDRDMVNESYQNSLKSKEAYEIKHRLLMPDGRIKWVKEQCETNFSDDGKPLFSMGFVQDITKEHELNERMHEQEKQLYESQKFSAMGEMIGNIAHQWRQPLNAISLTASSLNLKYEMNSLSKEDVDGFYKQVMKSTEFLSKTIDTFRNYLKEEKLFKEVVLQERIKSSLEIIDITLKDNYIKLIDNIDYSKSIKINLIVGELSQVLLNILYNAKDVLVEKKIENPWIKIDLEEKGNSVIITIEDNAKGISKDVLPHVFEPYFTTKHQSQGTGLGLYMAKDIVEKHLEGKLYVKNSENGAKFYIELSV